MTPIAEQAAHWWVVFGEGNASSAERREFGDWIVRAPERVEAYLRVASVSSALSRPDVRWPTTPADALIRDSLASRNDAIPLSRQRAPAPPREQRQPMLRWMVGLAASLLLVVCVGLFALSRPQQFQTQLGEQRTVQLGDGSWVTLNTATKIEVRLRHDRRSIRLVNGEALFEVARDPRRPFEVDSGNAVLRAVGTQFNVYRRPDRTVVTVVEGRVAMFVGDADRSRPSSHPLMAAADRIVIDSRGAGQIEHGVNLAAATAWSKHQLIFHRRTLGEVAEEFNRYNRRRIEIRSPALQVERVTATFQPNDPDSFVAFIAGMPGVRVADDGRGDYVITLDDTVAPPK